MSDIPTRMAEMERVISELKARLADDDEFSSGGGGPREEPPIKAIYTDLTGFQWIKDMLGEELPGADVMDQLYDYGHDYQIALRLGDYRIGFWVGRTSSEGWLCFIDEDDVRAIIATVKEHNLIHPQ